MDNVVQLFPNVDSEVDRFLTAQRIKESKLVEKRRRKIMAQFNQLLAEGHVIEIHDILREVVELLEEPC